jgi:predicted Holliday junction resolvase-like endonuclease
MTLYSFVLALAALAIVILAFLYVRARAQMHARAHAQYNRWRESDIEQIRAEQRELARACAENEFHAWCSEFEAEIRQDAIARSRSVIVGKVTEHLIPHMPVFPYNPKDARFLGSPVDLIVFDGCDEGDVRRVIFLEVKTNAGALTTRERQIRDAIKAGRVEWQELRIMSEPAGLVRGG